MVDNIQEIIQFRDLLFTWIERELRLRYKQSLLGVIWAMLQPVVLMALFVVMFSIFVRLPTDGIPYPIFAYTALLPWSYLATSLTFSSTSLVNNMNLVSKIYFPREILPLASVGAALVDFGIASLLLAVLLVIYRIPFQLTFVWIPVLVVVQTVFISGVVLFFSMLNAFYRDVRLVMPLAIQAWMYASPIIYPLSVVPDWLRPFYLLNPMAGLIDSYRRVILHGLPPEPVPFGIACISAAVLFSGGYWYFKRQEEILPDVI